MAKETDAEKQRHYTECIKIYETSIAALVKQEADILAECRQEPASAAVKVFRLAIGELDICSMYMIISGISLAVLEARSEAALDEARKAVLKSIIYIENIIGAKVDALYSDYEGALGELSSISPKEKLQVIRKMGLTIDMLKLAYGKQTKWKWAFVDIEGRFAAIAKNLLDLKKAQVNALDNVDYDVIYAHTQLVKRLLDKSGARFVERFELATRRVEDLRLAVNHLSALIRVKVMLADKDNIDLLKKKLESWQALLDLELHKVSKPS